MAVLIILIPGDLILYVVQLRYNKQIDKKHEDEIKQALSTEEFAKNTTALNRIKKMEGYFVSTAIGLADPMTIITS